MSKKRRTYTPRIVGDKVMMPADLNRQFPDCWSVRLGRPQCCLEVDDAAGPRRGGVDESGRRQEELTSISHSAVERYQTSAFGKA
jgi:hypothetical protein